MGLKRLDRLILGEIAGPWVFGTMLFTMLILAGQFLFQFTNYIVKGISPLSVIWLVGLNLPAVMVLTFPMATLLANLLGFGRLSGESEITAVRAAGASLYRVMVPVAIFGAAISVLTFCANEYVVPAASAKAEQLQKDIVDQLQGKSDQATVFPITDRSGRRIGLVAAGGFDLGARILSDVTITAFDSHELPSFFFQAKRLKYQDQRDWKIDGTWYLVSLTGDFSTHSDNGLWPRQVPMPELTPEEIQAQTMKKLDAQSMDQIRQSINTALKNPGFLKDQQLRNLQYGYWNKIALPLASLVYALVGAPFGIRKLRTGTATGFAFAILMIFIYFLLANVMGIAANAGAIPPAAAAFTPVFIGLLAAVYLIYTKNK